MHVHIPPIIDIAAGTASLSCLKYPSSELLKKWRLFKNDYSSEVIDVRHLNFMYTVEPLYFLEFYDYLYQILIIEISLIRGR